MHSPKPSDSLESSQPARKMTNSCLIVAATGLGKSQPTTELVLTPHGWRSIGTVRPLDQVIGSDGRWTDVLGVYPQGKLQVWEVEFSDRSVVRCSGDHLWTVNTKSRNSRGHEMLEMTTSQLSLDLRDGSGANKWFVPLVQPIQFQTADLRIDPYVYGVMLGDGCYNRDMSFTSTDGFIVDEMRRLLPDTDIYQKDDISYRIRVGPCTGFGVGSVLRQVLGRSVAQYKSVSQTYMLGDVDQRLALLQGLMDTDGTVRSKDGFTEFYSSSSRLAQDVCSLVRSLGGWATVRVKPPPPVDNRRADREGEPSYRTSINTSFNPFRLPRKARLWAAFKRVPRRSKPIVRITRLDIHRPCVCLKVDNADGLYVTSGYTLTHNTPIIAGMAKHWPRGRIMVISHRFELNQQLIGELETWCDDQVDLEQAMYHSDRGMRHRIVVASVQTLIKRKRNGKRRMDKFNPHEFGLVLIDEAHYAVNKSYREVISHFAQNPSCALVGVTATIDRLDGVGLSNVFNHVSTNYDINWGINNGWLVPITQSIYKLKCLKLDDIDTSSGDLNREQLRRQVESDRVFHEMALPFVNELGESQGIFFAESVEFARRMVSFIKAYRMDKTGECPHNFAVSIDGKLSPQDPLRRALVADFRRGDIKVLVNCSVLIEGFNVPAVSLIGIGKLTKSRMRYCQMAGRASRPLPGVVDAIDDPALRRLAIANSEKPNCRILDYIGQSRRHELFCSLDLMHGSEPAPVLRRAKRILASDRFKGTTQEAIDKARKEVQARQKREEARQVTVGQEYELIDREEAGEVYTLSNIEQPHCEWFLKKKQPTDGQQRMLKALGFTPNQIREMNPRYASKAIEYAIKQARTPFAKRLRKEKMEQMGSTLSQAVDMLGAIKQAKTIDELKIFGKAIAEDKSAGMSYVEEHRAKLAAAYKQKQQELGQ